MTEPQHITREDLRLVKWIAIVGGALWVGVGAPIMVYIAVGLFNLNTDYRASVAASSQWRDDTGQRIARIERKLDHIDGP